MLNLSLDISRDVFVILVMTAFVAGMIDAIAGGGGLITVPALLLAGLPPIETLATSKFQSTFGVATAAFSYTRAGKTQIKEHLFMMFLSFVSAALGTTVAHLMPVNVLRVIMPVILIGIALFFAFRKGLTDSDRTRVMPQLLFSFTVVPLIAAYDGFFGPGTGSFFVIAFVTLAGYGILKATAHTKLLNFSSNLGSLVVFAFSGAIILPVALAMAAAQILGSIIGARLAIKIGARLIKPLLVITSTIMALRLLWQVWAG